MSEGLTWIKTLKCKELIKKALNREREKFLEDLNIICEHHECYKVMKEKWEDEKNE